MKNTATWQITSGVDEIDNTHSVFEILIGLPHTHWKSHMLIDKIFQLVFATTIIPCDCAVIYGSMMTSMMLIVVCDDFMKLGRRILLFSSSDYYQYQ